MKTIAIILGTRPEIIKLAPVIHAMKESPNLKPIIIASGQHKEMAEQAFKIFNIAPDIDAALMQQNQDPNSLLSLLFHALDPILAKIKPAGVVVQGDTTTAMGSAIVAFHKQIPIAHIEAGLRTHNPLSPFPEEMNRTLISQIASIHFCPTQANAWNLNNEGITKNIYVVGNSVVDSLLWVQNKLENHSIPIEPAVLDIQELINDGGKYILVTGHRRENFDQPLINLCQVLKKLTAALPQVHVVYPVHRNPNVCGPVERYLRDQERIHLLPPVNYPSMVYLMQNAELIVSDSGGIQEEAPVLGKRVFVTRDTTERPEAVQAESVILASLNQPDILYQNIIDYLANSDRHAFPITSPFGDGKTAPRIISALESLWG